MAKSKFTFCIKCPTVYHLDSKCIPAGTVILTRNQHICIRHANEPRHKVPKLDWCSRCGEEDEQNNKYICCGSCPKTFHMSCLHSSEVSNPFLCEDCVNANNPLYGQLIVAKYGSDPWWPAVIVPAFKVPTHMYDDLPEEHQFCIQFFGDYSLGWTWRSSVHFYSKSEAAKFLIDSDRKQATAFKEAANWSDKMEKRDSNNNSSSSDNNPFLTINLESNETESTLQPPQYAKVTFINNNSSSDVSSISNISSNSSGNSSITFDLEGNGIQSSMQPPQYVKITSIEILAPAKLIASEDEPIYCSCNPDDPCGPTSSCLNRAMCIECNPSSCPNGLNCNNQCFQRKTYAAVKVVFINESKGFGLVADEFINAGQLVIEYVGELITESEFARRKSRKQKQSGRQHHYFMAHSKKLYIDLEKKGNEARFINHSCVPNCETQKWTVNKFDRIGYFAIDDIEKGTELTTNYDFDRGELHQCFCGEEICNGVIGSGNLKK